MYFILRRKVILIGRKHSASHLSLFRVLVILLSVTSLCGLYVGCVQWAFCVLHMHKMTASSCLTGVFNGSVVSYTPLVHHRVKSSSYTCLLKLAIHAWWVTYGASGFTQQSQHARVSYFSPVIYSIYCICHNQKSRNSDWSLLLGVLSCNSSIITACICLIHVHLLVPTLSIRVRSDSNV